MIQQDVVSLALASPIPSFRKKLTSPLTKQPITVLQINLGKRCNLTCSHCHVDASPSRTEELSPEVCRQLIELIERFPQIKVIDLTGGAPEMLYGFKPIVKAARANGKQVIVRSNLTIYFERGFSDIPDYCAQNQVRIVASLPCYLSDNVDLMRGKGVYDASIRALQWLNRLGYGRDPNLIIDLVYNPQLPTSANFSLTPNQINLERDYQIFLQAHFGIGFNNLFAITNLPIGRTSFHLERKKLYQPYLQFLASEFNSTTIERLMCRDELSIDYLGNVYDCDFNQMENLPAKTRDRQPITVADLLASDSLDLIDEIQTRPHCFGCTAGAGSSCGGTLVEI